MVGHRSERHVVSLFAKANDCSDCALGLEMPRVLIHLRLIVIFGGFLLSASSVQGCMAIVWLGAVGIDVTRTSDVEFHSFENSSVDVQQKQNLTSVKSIAVIPFAGDPVMAERWTAVLQQITDLRVVSPSAVTRPGGSGDDRIALAQRLSAEFQVDCVLFGSVAGQEPQKSFAGVKERSLRRMYLHLVSAEGALMWKSELPFTMVKGAKNLDEDMVTQALLTHVQAHADEVGLSELGARAQRTAS